MNACSRCRTNGIPLNSRYCPACGSPSPSAEDAAPDLTGVLGQMLLAGIVNAAERFIQSRVGRSLEPVDKIVEFFGGGLAAAPVPALPPPEWYERAFAEGQPGMDPTEVARRQAIAMAKARRAEQMVQTAIRSSHESKMTILGNIGRS